MSDDDEGGLEEPASESDSDEPEDTTHDAFGYPIVKDDEEKGDEAGEDEEDAEENEGDEEDKKPDDKKKGKKNSGYGDDVEEVIEDKPEEKEKTPEELTAEEALDKEFSETLKDIGEGYDQDKIKKFAKDHKFSNDQLKAYKELVKSENAESVKESERQLKVQRSTWLKELKADKEFGGANFDANVDRIEKLLENNMPNVKKALTEKGGMLPPYFMRDLLSLAKSLNPKTKFVGGNPPSPKKSSNDHLADLYK